tara:strand:+ start:2858 stop:3349 length:492 start_codon:yes stop_codon:yes gene_type:complete
MENTKNATPIKKPVTTEKPNLKEIIKGSVVCFSIIGLLLFWFSYAHGFVGPRYEIEQKIFRGDTNVPYKQLRTDWRMNSNGTSRLDSFYVDMYNKIDTILITTTIIDKREIESYSPDHPYKKCVVFSDSSQCAQLSHAEALLDNIIKKQLEIDSLNENIKPCN